MKSIGGSAVIQNYLHEMYENESEDVIERIENNSSYVEEEKSHVECIEFDNFDLVSQDLKSPNF